VACSKIPVSVLICGLGSIGRRHLRHFRALGCGPIWAYRTGKATLPDDGQPQPDAVFHELTAALAQKPDVVVVANPTALHVETALAAVRAGCHVLIEKPLSHRREGIAELVAETARLGRVVRVAQNLRFHPQLQRLRQMLTSGQPFGQLLLARAHIGGYLPDWHPWEDYRGSYAARRDLGGGAALTNIHELDYLTWLLGPARRFAGFASPLHPLRTDVDEVAAFVLEHVTGALSVATLSLAHKPQTRTLELSGAGGNASLDLLTGHLRLALADGTVREEPPPPGFSLDDTYRAQAADFLAALDGQPGYGATLAEAVHDLEIALCVQSNSHD
jgi:predicted dehydrogenase